MKLSEEQSRELAKSYHTGTSPVQLINNYYNQKRPHKHNNYQSPNEKEILALNSSK